MDVQVKALGVELTDHLADFCREHIVEPLRRIYDREGPTLEIELSDENGTKGGLDKRCRISFTMPHTRSLTVVQVSHDIFTAVDLAGHRFQRLVRRYKGWKLEKSRYPKKYFLAERELATQPGERSSPEDVTQEEDSLAAVEAQEQRDAGMAAG